MACRPIATTNAHKGRNISVSVVYWILFFPYGYAIKKLLCASHTACPVVVLARVRAPHILHWVLQVVAPCLCIMDTDRFHLGSTDHGFGLNLNSSLLLVMEK